MVASASRRALATVLAPWKACLGGGSPVAAAESTDTVELRPLLPPASQSPRSCAPAPMPAPDSPASLRELAQEPLHTQSPARIAQALCLGLTSKRADKSLLAKDVLLSLRGAHLLAVKEAVEAQLPGALCGFVYGNPHIVPHRRQLVDHMAANVPAGERPLYVLSDIDNTFSPTRDGRYPKGTQCMTYPGQSALYAALAPERLTFLTARFGEPMRPVRFMARRTRRHTEASLRNLGVENPNILFGSLRYLPYPTLEGVAMAPLGTKKLVNFARMASLFPEYRYVFFGDSCEDDLRVATRMREGVVNKELPRLPGEQERPTYRAAATFVHDFDGRAGKRVSPQARQAAEAQQVIFYTSAVDAALGACLREDRLGLGVTPDTVRAIARVAQEDLDAVPFAAEQQVERACLQSALELERAAVEATLPPLST